MIRGKKNAFSNSSFVLHSSAVTERKSGIEKERKYLWLDILFSCVSQCYTFSSQSPRSSLTEFSLFVAFRDLRPVSLEKGQETLRLRVYACYAWGGPFLVAGLAALLDHLPPQPQYTFLRPRFGEKQCWFYGKFLPCLSSLLRELSYRRVNSTCIVTLLAFAKTDY